MKEITYKHAEGFATGELKHGPLALATEDTPVFAAVVGDGEQARKTVGNVKEVEARDAPVIAVTDGRSDVERYADKVLEFPESRPEAAAVLANVQLQLVSYYTAKEFTDAICCETIRTNIEVSYFTNIQRQHAVLYAGNKRSRNCPVPLAPADLSSGPCGIAQANPAAGDGETARVVALWWCMI